ncbi:MAG: hypothetical protein FJ357_07910 [Thaumarchaeota archaeon]|nr:hypothetical protein [Nitrososphaerota archaeon]
MHYLLPCLFSFGFCKFFFGVFLFGFLFLDFFFLGSLFLGFFLDIFLLVVWFCITRIQGHGFEQLDCNVFCKCVMWSKNCANHYSTQKNQNFFQAALTVSCTARSTSMMSARLQAVLLTTTINVLSCIKGAGIIHTNLLNTK